MKIANFSLVVKKLSRFAFAATLGILVACDDSKDSYSYGDIYADCTVVAEGAVSVDVGATGFSSLSRILVKVDAPTTRFERSYRGNGEANWFEQYDIRGREGDRIQVDFSIEDNDSGSFKDYDTTVCSY